MRAAFTTTPRQTCSCICLIPLFTLVEREALARATGGRRSGRRAASRERAAGLAARWRALASPWAYSQEAAKPLLVPPADESKGPADVALGSAVVFADGAGDAREDSIESLWSEAWAGAGSAAASAPLH